MNSDSCTNFKSLQAKVISRLGAIHPVVSLILFPKPTLLLKPTVHQFPTQKKLLDQLKPLRCRRGCTTENRTTSCSFLRTICMTSCYSLFLTSDHFKPTQRNPSHFALVSTCCKVTFATIIAPEPTNGRMVESNSSQRFSFFFASPL